jgi:hypothetical protein
MILYPVLLQPLQRKSQLQKQYDTVARQIKVGLVSVQVCTECRIKDIQKVHFLYPGVLVKIL